MREEPDKAGAEERNKKIQQLISCVQKAASTSRNPTRRQCGSARNQHVKREPPHALLPRGQEQMCKGRTTWNYDDGRTANRSTDATRTHYHIFTFRPPAPGKGHKGRIYSKAPGPPTPTTSVEPAIPLYSHHVGPK